MAETATVDAAGPELITRELDLVQVKGKNEPVKIFELCGLDNDDCRPSEQLQTILPIYAEAVERYQARDWSQALALFGECLSLKPSDRPSEIYLERTAHYRSEPPPDDWSGVYEFTTK